MASRSFLRILLVIGILAGSVLALAADRDRRERLGRSARERVREFDAERVGSRYGDVFLDLVQAVRSGLPDEARQQG